MREYAARRGWTIAVQVREVGSGAAKREAREKLLEAARRREIDVVLVWRLDRWGRSVTDLLATLQELEHLGVGFVSLTEALDLTTPAGRAMAGLLAVFAAFEREILGERTRAGLGPRPAERQTSGPARNGSRARRRDPETTSRRRQPKLRSPAGSRSGAPRYAESEKRRPEMLKAWHKEDVFNALQARGWMGPVLLEYPKDWNYVGEAWSFFTQLGPTKPVFCRGLWHRFSRH